MLRKTLILMLGWLFLVSAASAQMTFYLIDNFEDGDLTISPAWYSFDNVKLSVVENQKPAKIDFVAESAGAYRLQVTGQASDWYVGGFGVDQAINAEDYSRLQFDLYGNSLVGGKLKIEFYDDDNNNNRIEQDPQAGWVPIADDKWAVEVNILGDGFTRYSIPFSAFKDENPGVGNDIFDPVQKNGSGGLLKIQLIAIASEKKSKVDFGLDNILLTY